MSTKPKLPELPEPNCREGDPLPSPEGGFWTDLYDGDQLRAYALRAVKAERERCAERCIGKAKHWIALGPSLNWEFRAHGAEECAEAIRSLPDPD